MLQYEVEDPSYLIFLNLNFCTRSSGQDYEGDVASYLYGVTELLCNFLKLKPKILEFIVRLLDGGTLR